MPQIKILKDGSNIMFTADAVVEMDSPIVSEMVAALGRHRGMVPSTATLDIDRTDPAGIFSYVLVTKSPDREFRQTWYFDVAITNVGFTRTPTGVWTFMELTAMAPLREILRRYFETLGFSKLSCKW